MKQKAFTLIELLLAVSILSLAASIVLAQVKVAQGKARDTVRAQQARQIDNAIQLYIQEHGYAPDLQGTCASQSQVPALYGVSACFAISTSGSEAQAGAWQKFKTDLAPYMKDIPNDPCPTCESASGLPIGYTYVAPLYMYDQCVKANGAENCSVGNYTNSYQMYAPLERNNTPAGNSSGGNGAGYYDNNDDEDGSDEEDTTAPSVPTGVTVELAGSWQNGLTIQISWDESTDEGSGIAGYKITPLEDNYYNQDEEGNFVPIPPIPGTSRTVGVLQWSQGISFPYAVVAYDNAGNASSPSVTVFSPVIPPFDAVPPTVNLEWGPIPSPQAPPGAKLVRWYVENATYCIGNDELGNWSNTEIVPPESFDQPGVASFYNITMNNTVTLMCGGNGGETTDTVLMTP